MLYKILLFLRVYSVRVIGVILLCITLVSCVSLSPDKPLVLSDNWQYLLDDNLSHWEKWMGVPHVSVTGLPNGTFQSENLNVHGNPSNAMGLDSDIKNVFSTFKQDGQTVLHISGEIYGGLTTLAKFENYHLSLQVKWGDKKWAPRLNAKRDSGLLFHCEGPHGAFWKAWKACQELQIQETDFGDYIPLAGPSGKVRMAKLKGKFKYDPNGKYDRVATGYTHASAEPDFANGEWNTVELFAFKDKAIFIVNNTVVMVLDESRDKDGKSLTLGQIQVQSEGAEVFYRDMKIRSIKQLPEITSFRSN